MKSRFLSKYITHHHVKNALVSWRFEINLSSGGTRCHDDTEFWKEKKKKSLPLAVLFPPATWWPLASLPRILTLILPFHLWNYVVKGKGQRSHSTTSFELVRGIVPKFLRQHILLTLILRVSHPGPQIVVGGGCGTHRSLSNHL